MGAAGLKLPFLTSGAAATWAFARAQQSAKLPRIGVLWHAGNAEQEATSISAADGVHRRYYPMCKNSRVHTAKTPTGHWVA